MREEMGEKLIKIVVLPICFLILFGVICCLVIFFLNEAELDFCKEISISTSSIKTIYEDNSILDKCILVEDDEELTVSQWMHKHKYDGVEVRK